LLRLKVIGSVYFNSYTEMGNGYIKDVAHALKARDWILEIHTLTSYKFTMPKQQPFTDGRAIP
jgi:hypothetical protein